MQTRKKFIFFIALVVIFIIIDIFTGNKIAGIGCGILGIIGAAFAGISGRRSGGSTAIADADRKAADLERENRAAAGSLDRVLRDGDGLRDAGIELVRNGADLVGESKNLIDELRRGDAGANKGA